MELSELAQDFTMLSDRERFLYLLELGEQLEEYPDTYRTKEYEVPGCTSLVFVRARLEDGKVFFDGVASAKAVAGYLHILIQALSNKTPQQVIEDTSVEQFIQEAQMNVSTRVSRAQAFGNLYAFMKQQAKNISEQ